MPKYNGALPVTAAWPPLIYPPTASRSVARTARSRELRTRRAANAPPLPSPAGWHAEAVAP